MCDLCPYRTGRTYVQSLTGHFRSAIRLVSLGPNVQLNWPERSGHYPGLESVSDWEYGAGSGLGLGWVLETKSPLDTGVAANLDQTLTYDVRHWIDNRHRHLRPPIAPRTPQILGKGKVKYTSKSDQISG